jgi:hypothetical protein
MSSDPRPRDGDLIVARRQDGRGFEISVVPGEAQLVTLTLEDALAKSQQWASRKGAVVWIADGSGELRPAGVSQG